MKTSTAKALLASFVTIVLASFVVAPEAEAQRRGGGGGGGGGGARAGGGGDRQGAQVNNSRADTRTTEVRNTSVNNVSAERNVNVNVDCTGRCGGWDHPVAAAAVVGGTIAAIGSAVATVPANCVPVNHGGIVYQQCGSTWYAPQGSQYVVVNPPN